MICETCGNTKAYRMQQTGSEPWSCDRCGVVDSVFVPDVYFKPGYVSEHLVDKKGNPVQFGSRMEKYNYMKEHNLSEAGDRVRGERGFLTNVSRETPTQRRQFVQEAVAKARARMRGYGRAYG